MNIYSSINTSIVHHFRKPVNCICCKKELSSAANLSRHYESHNHNPIQSSNLFLDNKYTKLYFKLVSKEMYDGYTEKHHIIPRSMGGDNSKENIISISARYHFLCHYLLTKMVKKDSKEWRSLVKAFNMMNANSNTHDDRYMNAKLFESNRKYMSLVMSVNSSGEKNSNHGSMWITEITTGESTRIKKEEWDSYDKTVWSKGRVHNKDVYFDKLANPDSYSKNNIKLKPKLRNCMIDYSLPESERYLEENMEGARQISNKNKLARYLEYDFDNSDIDCENFKLRNKLIDMHITKQMKITEIAKKYNLSRNSVVDTLNFLGIQKYFYNTNNRKIANKTKNKVIHRNTLIDQSLPESKRYLEENMKGAKRLSSQNKLAAKLGYDFNNEDIDYENIKIRNKLIDLYVTQELSIPKICKLYDANIRSVELLMIFCGIDRR